MPFEPFIGIGPRRYGSLFAHDSRKQNDGTLLSYDRMTAPAKIEDRDPSDTEANLCSLLPGDRLCSGRGGPKVIERLSAGLRAAFPGARGFSVSSLRYMRAFLARYPNRTHFVDAQNPHQALLTSLALFHGDPVVVAYPDGREVLFTPKRADGLVAVVLLLALFWIKLRERPSSHEPIQLPPRTQVEVRDASGLPLAA